MQISESHSTTEKAGLYETDFYAWTQEQVQLLRNRQFDAIDLENLIEEVESLGRQERRELENRLSILIGHLLKWEYQPEKRSDSWLATIRIQRRDTLKLLKENPSLKSYLEEAVGEAYENGRDLAKLETKLAITTFPTECLYRFSEILDPEFYPGEASDLVNEWED